MYIPPEKIKDPTNSEAEDEMIIGAFLRQLEEEKIKARWQGKLEREHGFARPKDPPAKRVTLRRAIFAAVAVAATALILLMVLRFDRPNGPELLAGETEDIELIAFRGSGRTAVDAQRQSVNTAFFDGEYELATTLSSALVDGPAASSLDVYNHGLLLLRVGDTDAAARQFSLLIERGDDYRSEAILHRAMAYLTSQRVEEGLRELRAITPDDGDKLYKRARALIEADWE